jgi:hypothetical protein
VRTSANPRELFFEAQKLRVRVDRLLENLERVVGARPGRGLQVEMNRPEAFTDVISHAGRRIALGLTAASAMVGTAVTSAGSRPARWSTPAFATTAAVLTGALLADVLRRR